MARKYTMSLFKNEILGIVIVVTAVTPWLLWLSPKLLRFKIEYNSIQFVFKEYI